ncbi:G-type lectin S-receptor-like serine/threonine-protein kinase SD2-5 [Selaginella moellendorffii]|uniref:G-type lectin S-receptor-like serine/threonine-protein kinase SD2-5 n=1 Tax=Selaginella moellendorffii TaxID=88036 RepID=UPI000D1CE570|nr:G-type lectin S-receptor-like serine/threonine-protein kinase SD2-5 [Selaginella moellendorffii]|eukprot:XP_024536589.1 G-type lectin S-receptor-like serine/threonine-protein kinase SD2-5 [Selaginella moellendorffii]
MGCSPATGYYEPCTPRSLRGTRGVWKATYFDNVLQVTWKWIRKNALFSLHWFLVEHSLPCGALKDFLVEGRETVQCRQEEAPSGGSHGCPAANQVPRAVSSDQGIPEQVGEGGLGTVFKGTLPSGEIVAVKRIGGGSRQEDKQFKAEVMSIGSIHHLNLVKLDFACILPTTYSSTRLAYLHDGCREKVLRLDIKPQNILLDEKMNAKIADFGFSKFIDKDKTHVVTVMRGTVGYMAPEWLHSRVTDKTEVYSFGIVLLELVCSIKAVECSLYSDSQMDVVFLTQTAFNKLHSGNAKDLVDDRLLKAEDGGGFFLSGFENILLIGLWCTQEDPLRRPTMSVVVKMLEGAMDVLALPQLERPAAQDSSLLVSSSESSGVQISISVLDLAR